MTLEPNLAPEVIQMLVSNIMQNSKNSLSEIEGERLLNAIARAQSGVPTGVPSDRN